VTAFARALIRIAKPFQNSILEVFLGGFHHLFLPLEEAKPLASGVWACEGAAPVENCLDWARPPGPALGADPGNLAVVERHERDMVMVTLG